MLYSYSYLSLRSFAVLGTRSEDPQALTVQMGKIDVDVDDHGLRFNTTAKEILDDGRFRQES